MLFSEETAAARLFEGGAFLIQSLRSDDAEHNLGGVDVPSSFMSKTYIVGCREQKESRYLWKFDYIAPSNCGMSVLMLLVADSWFVITR
jgi:hypothetical protein